MDASKVLDDELGGMSLPELGRLYRVLRLFAAEARDRDDALAPPDALEEAAAQVHEVMQAKGFTGDPQGPQEQEGRDAV